MSAALRFAALGALALAGCAGKAGPSVNASQEPPRRAEAAAVARPRGSVLDRAWASYRASRYVDAEAGFRPTFLTDPRARLGLASVLLETGRYEEVAAVAAETAGAPAGIALDLTWLRAEGLRRLGKLEEAERTLTSAAGDPEARRVRLALGEVLLDQGRVREAEPVLMTLIEQYNQDAIAAKDGAALAMVGRAATLLGSPQDANDAFNQAERAGDASPETLLWRADLFLENYDPGHAEEVLGELLSVAPHHPEALARMAEVKLASNLDFDAAEALVRQALAGNPHLARAEFVLGGVALRDMDFVKADAAVDRGIAANPRDLDLLSLRAAVRFLADDRPGFERAKEAVLSRNPRYSRLYQIIGEYAEWEHRYEEIVVMMREALLADPGDARVRAQLGFNLIRSGEEQDGVAALQRAFSVDPFNVRVFNTLNLYEKEIPKGYETVPRGRFVFRYGKDEKEVLDRYIPGLLERAWTKMTRKYDFVPATPVGVELYPTREHFAVRTSGLPQTFIQGVCFGRTLAAMSPRSERFNIGMTLWHELAHVFHIQLSRSRVPRWFTEGLAEYETLVERPEWRREHDAELFDAFERGRVPAVADLNRAFTHADDMQDMATAYYASTQVVAFIAERWGMPKIRRMLELWGTGKRTPEVVREALGVSVEEVDREFRAGLSRRLAGYHGQFWPPTRPVDLPSAEARARAVPGDAERQAELALALMGAGEETRAKAALDVASKLDPKEPLALWLRAQLAKTTGDRPGAKRAFEALIAAGHDGYTVELALADVAGSPAGAKQALEAAHRFDPLQAAPLRALAEIANDAHDDDAEASALRELTLIEENDGEAHRRLLTLLIARREFSEARRVGEAAIYVDVESAETHRLYAEALAGGGARKEALYELESAVRAGGSSTELRTAHERLAELLDRSGDHARALLHRKTAAELARDSRTGPI